MEDYCNANCLKKSTNIVSVIKELLNIFFYPGSLKNIIKNTGLLKIIIVVEKIYKKGYKNIFKNHIDFLIHDNWYFYKLRENSILLNWFVFKTG